MNPSDISVHIQEFLGNEGISRLTLNDVGKKISKEKKPGEGENVIGLYQLGFSVDERPYFYDFFQSYYPFFDVRAAFLPRLGQFIDTLKTRQITIADGGCASGIDICFFASSYRDSGMSFFGYDKGEEFVQNAQNRANRLELNNINFAKATHSDFSAGAIWVDMIYTKMSIHPKTDTARGVSEGILEVCRRPRPGGYYIEACALHPREDELELYLRQGGLRFIQMQNVIEIPERRLSLYNHILQKE